MRRSTPFILVIGILILCGGFFLPLAAESPAVNLAGIWAGKLSVSGTELELDVKIKLNADGTYGGTLDVPAQGAKDIPLSKVTFDAGKVNVEIALIGAAFEGVLSADGLEINGQFKQRGAVLPLVMRKTDQAAALKRPQTPQKPYPYKEEDVSYENKAGGIKLAGTLTIPEGMGPFPAVILITGSGAQDRDETLIGHKPFLVLADYLTRRGIAVLRSDDRGVGGSTGDLNLATDNDLAEDALAAMALLKSRKEIDPKRIGLLGHSEGGIIAPIAAVRSQDVAFAVLMAGPGIPGDELIVLQTELILRAGGADEKLIARECAIQEQLYDILKTESGNAAAEKKLRAAYTDYLSKLASEERAALGDPEAFVSGQIQTILTPWFRFFIAYDPRPTLRQVSCPVLAVNGEKDLQVPYREDLTAIEDALKNGRCKDYTIKSLPGLNHLFQTCTTGSPAEYGAIEETISPTALQVMGDWLVAHTAK